MRLQMLCGAGTVRGWSVDGFVLVVVHGWRFLLVICFLFLFLFLALGF